MNRQSARKVKLTSKFEEFTSSRLSKVVSPKVEPGTRKSAAAATTSAASAASSTPASSAPHTAPTTPVPTPAPASQPPPPIISTPITTRIHHKLSTPITPMPDPRLSYLPKLTANGKIRGRPRKCWQQQKAETVVKPMSTTREELLRLREENLNLRQQLEQAHAEYDDLKRQSSYTGQTVPKVDYDDLKEKYQIDIAHAKRREWCAVCLTPSRYYCCWNTTYCSQKCQVSDWFTRHMKSCERRKTLKKVS